MLIADFATDIKEKLRQFNRILISTGELTTDDRVILKKRLKEIIEFHSEARELSVEFNSKQIFLSNQWLLYIFRFATRFSNVNSAIVSACPMFIIAVFGSFVLQFNVVSSSSFLIIEIL